MHRLYKKIHSNNLNNYFYLSTPEQSYLAIQTVFKYQTQHDGTKIKSRDLEQDFRLLRMCSPLYLTFIYLLNNKTFNLEELKEFIFKQYGSVDKAKKESNNEYFDKLLSETEEEEVKIKIEEAREKENNEIDSNPSKDFYEWEVSKTTPATVKALIKEGREFLFKENLASLSYNIYLIEYNEEFESFTITVCYCIKGTKERVNDVMTFTLDKEIAKKYCDTFIKGGK